MRSNACDLLEHSCKMKLRQIGSCSYLSQIELTRIVIVHELYRATKAAIDRPGSRSFYAWGPPNREVRSEQMDHQLPDKGFQHGVTSEHNMIDLRNDRARDRTNGLIRHDSIAKQDFGAAVDRPNI